MLRQSEDIVPAPDSSVDAIAPLERSEDEMFLVERDPRAQQYALRPGHGPNPALLELVREITSPSIEGVSEVAQKCFGHNYCDGQAAIVDLCRRLQFFVDAASRADDSFHSPRGRKPDLPEYRWIVALALEYELAGGKISYAYRPDRDTDCPDASRDGWSSPFVLFLCALGDAVPASKLKRGHNAMAKLAERALNDAQKRGLFSKTAKTGKDEAPQI